MPQLPLLSLAINIAVLVPVCASLLLGAAWIERAFGPPGPARGILASVYLAILIVSLALLVWRQPWAIAALLLVQVTYKLTTPFTVGTLRNPVVLSNLAIAAFHLAALASLWPMPGCR